MVEYITIKKKMYPVKIGYYVMKKVKELTGADSLEKAVKENRENLELYETMLWAALRQGAWEEDVELDLKEDEMDLALGSCFKEFVEIMASAKFYPEASEEDIEKAELQKQAESLGKEAEGSEEEKKQTLTRNS